MEILSFNVLETCVHLTPLLISISSFLCILCIIVFLYKVNIYDLIFDMLENNIIHFD